MKKFQFRLQKLLEIREHKEKLVKNELAKAQRKKNIILTEKEKILNEFSEGRKKMKGTEEKRYLTVGELDSYQKYFKRLKAATKEKDKQIAGEDIEINKINYRLIEARKEKRILEKLKEKKLSQYNYEVQKEDQNFFDEVGTTQFLMQKKVQLDEVKENLEIPIKYREYDKTVTEKLYEKMKSELEGEK